MGCEGTSEPDFNGPEVRSNDLQVAPPIQPGRGLEGTWRATSILIGDTEILAGTDNSFVMTFRSDDTYSIDIYHESGEFCDGDTSCLEIGTYTYTSSTITFFDGTGDDTGNYVFCGGRLIFVDEGVRIAFQRTHA
jgi:hypothetical protein